LKQWTALGLMLSALAAAPAAGAASQDLKPFRHHRHHRHVDRHARTVTLPQNTNANATTEVPSAPAPWFFPRIGPSPPANREIDGLSRERDDCNMGCIDR
jgi:hypothetical protein